MVLMNLYNPYNFMGFGSLGRVLMQVANKTDIDLPSAVDIHVMQMFAVPMHLACTTANSGMCKHTCVLVSVQIFVKTSNFGFTQDQ